MSEKAQRNPGSHVLIILASLVVVIGGLKVASGILLPLMVALFVATLSLPLLAALQKIGLPRPLAVLLTLAAIVLVFAGLGLLVGGSVTEFTDPQIQASYRAKFQAAVDRSLSHLDVLLSRMKVDTGGRSARELIDPNSLLDVGALFGFVGRTLKQAVSVVSNTFLVILTVIFILFEAAAFPDKIRAAMGHRLGALDRFAGIKTEIQNYLAIKTMISMTTGILVGLSLWILGIDFPLLWGLVAFLCNYIPSLGSIIAAVPAVMLTIVQVGFGRALIVAAVFLAINIPLGNFLEPYLLGRRLGLSTLVVFLSLVFWGWVWGPVGMLLSVPLTMIVKIMLEHTEDLRWIAVLLDARAPDPGRRREG